MKKKILIIFTCMLMILTSFVLVANASVISVNDNNPPNPPEITGPSSGTIDEYYVYTIYMSDPDFDDGLLRLEVDFGDGTVSEDCGCDRIWENPKTLEIEHKWKRSGDYLITGRVQDVHGEWSEWSEPLFVTMPKLKWKTLFIFQWIGELIPNLYNIF